LADIDLELSVMVARFPDGRLSFWDPSEMVFHQEANMLAFQLCPARISGEQAKKAQDLAAETAEKLELIGLLAVEFFLLKDGGLWINEMAPRPHNSGHQTIEASYTSQFEQYLRILLGLDPGSTLSKSSSALVNLLGAADAQGVPDYSSLESVFKEDACHVHIYGKTEVKPYRKMGHLCLLGDDIRGLEQRAREISEAVKVTEG
jgi:5-(carboxyamino)imidazole ribonucleotide synthase